MKKILSFALLLAMTLSLAACGGKTPAGGPEKEAPDLNQYYEDFMAQLGEDNSPAMGDVEGEALEGLYPGLGALETKQLVVKTAKISAVAFEFALVEVADSGDVQAAADIFQARIDYQIETGAYYPATLESWENARIITQGNVVALICAGSEQAQAEEAFNQLFQ